MILSLVQKMADAHGMTDAVWKRHANPWSVWTRFAVLPLLALAIWSRVWVGGWSLVPIGLLCLFIWLNPRLFPPPRSTKNWGSKATFGERVWLNRCNLPIPRHHAIAAAITSTLAGLGALFLIPGLIWLHFWATLTGVLLAYIGKMWFLDRMVWLYEDMKTASEQYLAWEY